MPFASSSTSDPDLVGRVLVPVLAAAQLGQTLPVRQQAGATSMLRALPVVGFAFVAPRCLVAGLSKGSVQG